ncbi:MAG TPA: caspase family protein [Polyangia bacterium]|jgi:hypothetical protein
MTAAGRRGRLVLGALLASSLGCTPLSYSQGSTSTSAAVATGSFPVTFEQEARGARRAFVRRAPPRPAAVPAVVEEAPPPRPAGPRRPAATAYVPGTPQPAAFALIIGIEQYRNAPAPIGARADARRFKELARTTLGIPERNIRLLLDDAATRTDIEAELDWLKANVRAGGRIYFFFSGHGAPDPSAGTPYLLPSNGRPEALARTALPLAEVLRALSDTKAKEVLAFVDSCFSGAGGRSVLPPGARPLVVVKEETAAQRLALFSAAGGAEISGPDQDSQGGLFTKYLLQGLGSARADINGDGQVSLQELADWVRPRVEAEARRQNRAQRPGVVLGSGLSAAADVIVAAGVEAR